MISIAALPLIGSDMLKCALHISSRSFSAPEVSIRDLPSNRPATATYQLTRVNIFEPTWSSIEYFAIGAVKEIKQIPNELRVPQRPVLQSLEEGLETRAERCLRTKKHRIEELDVAYRKSNASAFPAGLFIRRCLCWNGVERDSLCEVESTC